MTNIINFPAKKFFPDNDLINEALKKINQHLSELNKFSAKELGSSCVDENLLGFKIANGWEISFRYDLFDKHMTCYCFKDKTNLTNNCTFQFKKNQMSNNTKRRKISLWIVEHIFKEFGNSEELDLILSESIFGSEHNFILYA